jgi:outer membrane receptor for ferrienterochelin and colicin
VAGGGISTLSGIDGRYTLQVPSTPVDLVVTFVGYSEQTVRRVGTGEASSVARDISMTPAALLIEGVSVTVANQGTVSRALEEQRLAVGVVSAITSEQISRSPDGNAAAAVQRVSGVTVQDGKFVFVRGLGERYTNTSLNGSRLPSPEPEKKIVPLDLFPSGLLQTITTSKTFTPDLPGDFSGAQIDIRTREYPAGRQFTLSLSQGFNAAVVGKSLPMAPTAGGEWYAAATGPRALPAAVKNSDAPALGPETNRVVNAMRDVWSSTTRDGRPNSSASASLGGSDGVLGQQIGYLFSGTWSFTDEIKLGTIRENLSGDHYAGNIGKTSAMLGGIANLSTGFGANTRISLNNTYNRTADNEAQVESGFYENHGTNIRIERLKYVERTVRSNQLLGEHQLTSWQRFDWSVTSSGVSRQEPDRSEYITWLDPATPVWYNQGGAFRAWSGLKESSLEAAFNDRIDLNTNATRVLKFGALVRQTDRDAYDTGYSISSRQWSQDDARWQVSPETFFDGRYATDSDSLFYLAIFSAGGNYSASDRLYAGYGMFEWSLTPALKLIGGARVERTETAVGYESVLGDVGTATPAWTDVLPSLAMDLDLTNTQKLRLSASRTLARPEYREIAPICYHFGLGEEQRCGSPDLVRTLVSNADVRWEQYPSAGEVLSVALFAKHFDKPIEARYRGTSGLDILAYENAESAVNYGVELEASRGLGFVLGSLSDFSAFSNVTLMKSRVRTGRENDGDRAMTGQAPYVVNAGLTWTKPTGSTSATIMYNVVGDRIINARLAGNLVPDMVEVARPGLDLGVRFPLLGSVNAKLDLKNLLDSPYEVRQGDLIRSRYTTGRSVSLGLSWSQ